MRILHTSDWHLGKKLSNFSRIEEQKIVLDEIIDRVKELKIDLVIISGDIYDTFHPSNESMELLYETLYKISENGKRCVLAIAGNHDSAEGIDVPEKLAKNSAIFFLGDPTRVIHPFITPSGIEVIKSDYGFVELYLPSCGEKVRVLLTPYVNESRLKVFLGPNNEDLKTAELLGKRWSSLAKKYCDEDGVNILMGHLFMVPDGEKYIEPDDEKPIVHIGGLFPLSPDLIPDEIQYTALGHLHKPFLYHNSKNRPIAYSGSILEYSFRESLQDKSLFFIEASPSQEAKITKIPIEYGKKLIQYSAESFESAIEWLKINQDCFVELTISTDKYLDSMKIDELQKVHSGIVSIIPIVANIEGVKYEKVDLLKDIKTLFKEYYQAKFNSELSKDVEGIFLEMLGDSED
ncbi:exonuclease subunit SbcD [bacterium]|nr:exonuclease subunit SbcD [bacterium]